MTTPLSGVKVIELARILAGPWAGQTLADLGADVIKVEAPEGDDTRRWGPPFITRDGDTSAAYFYATNRGKRSITCDFRTPEGQETVRKLVADGTLTIEQQELLIKTTESPVVKALEKLDGKVLKRLGVTIKADSDEVLIKAVDGEVDKAVAVFLKSLQKDATVEAQQ